MLLMLWILPWKNSPTIPSHPAGVEKPCPDRVTLGEETLAQPY